MRPGSPNPLAERASAASAEACLVRAFGRAAGKLHLVLLDTAAKLIWIVGTLGLFWLTGAWFAANVALTGGEVAAIRSGSPTLAMAGLGSALFSSRGLLAGSVTFAVVMSGLLWCLIEAFTRAGILTVDGHTFVRDAGGNFSRFFASGMSRRLILGLAALLVGLIALGPLLTAPYREWIQWWPDARWPALAGALLLGQLAFFLTILDTLVRSDAVDLLGARLPGICRIVGLLTLLELAFAALAVLVTLSVSALSESPEVTLITGFALLAGLSVLHSYLLIVRYAAVGIMRRGRVGEPAHSHGFNH